MLLLLTFDILAIALSSHHTINKLHYILHSGDVKRRCEVYTERSCVRKLTYVAPMQGVAYMGWRTKLYAGRTVRPVRRTFAIDTTQQVTCSKERGLYGAWIYAHITWRTVHGQCEDRCVHGLIGTPLSVIESIQSTVHTGWQQRLTYMNDANAWCTRDDESMGTKNQLGNVLKFCNV